MTKLFIFIAILVGAHIVQAASAELKHAPRATERMVEFRNGKDFYRVFVGSVPQLSLLSVVYQKEGMLAAGADEIRVRSLLHANPKLPTVIIDAETGDRLVLEFNSDLTSVNVYINNALVSSAKILDVQYVRK